MAAPAPDRALAALAREIGGCTTCAAQLPLGPRPVVRLSAAARILIIGQAPGTKVHATGLPWNDPSGDRLRAWLGMSRDEFYDPARIAIMPMGFCYPGRLANGGDAPPRTECAPQWHARVRALLPAVKMTLLVGRYAQAHYLGPARGATLADAVRAYRDHLPDFFVLPHPSWRTLAWAKKNPWFEAEVIPALRKRARAILR
ncbi:MAG: uracil-DNA glycosylase family protein [Alphaproteobacteria bacterium]